MTKLHKPPALPDTLLRDLRSLIAVARQNVAQAVNSALVILYWKVGDRIRRDLLRDKRAEYGEEILPTLSAKLAVEFGAGFTEKNLRHMVRFAEVFPEEQIVYALSRELADEFGNGFSRCNLFNMTRFAEVSPEFEIVHALSAQSSRTHFVTEESRHSFFSSPLRGEGRERVSRKS